MGPQTVHATIEACKLESELLKEAMDVGSLVPAEIRAEDAEQDLVFNSTKDNMAKILQEENKEERGVIVNGKVEDLRKSRDDVDSEKDIEEDGAKAGKPTIDI